MTASELEALVAERERLDSLIKLGALEVQHEEKLATVHPSSHAAVKEIRRVMRETGTTLQAVADRCGIKKQAVEQALTGHKQVAKQKGGGLIGISLRTVYRFADALNHDVHIQLVPRSQAGK